MEIAIKKAPPQPSSSQIWSCSTFHCTIEGDLFWVLTDSTPLKLASVQPEQATAHGLADLHAAADASGTFSLCNSHFSPSPSASSPSATFNKQ